MREKKKRERTKKKGQLRLFVAQQEKKKMENHEKKKMLHSKPPLAVGLLLSFQRLLRFPCAQGKARKRNGCVGEWRAQEQK